MKKTIAVCLLLGLNYGFLSVLKAQNHFSVLLRMDDTVSTSSLFPLVSGDRIHVLRFADHLGIFTGFNRVLSLDQFSFQGGLLLSKRIDPQPLQGYQTVNSQPFLKINDKFLVAADQFFPDPDTNPQSAVVFGLEENGQTLWKNEFIESDYLSTCGILVPDSMDYAYHLNIRAAAIGSDQSISVRHLNEDGQVAWTKQVALPNTIEREYLYVHSGIYTGKKIIAVCSYGLLSSPTVDYLLVTMDSMANLISSEELTGLNNPLLGNRANKDTFYFDAYDKVGNQTIHCLETHVNDFSENLNTVCADDLPVGVSYYPYDLRVGPDGSVYIVGERDSANTICGWISKWTPGGNLLWNRSYGCSATNPEGVCFFSSLDFFPNGNLVVTGQAKSTAPPTYPRYDWLLTLDGDGCFNGVCEDFVIIDSETVGVENSNVVSKMQCQIWPNPAKNDFTISFAEPGYVSVFNAQGVSIVDFSPVEPGTMNFTLSGWASGNYFVYFLQEDGKSSTTLPLIVWH